MLRDVAGDEAAGLRALLALECDVREASREQDLHYIIANETRGFTQARQVFVLRSIGGMRLVAATGLTVVDRSAPTAEGIETLVAALQDVHGLDVARVFETSDLEHEGTASLAKYPFRHLSWHPMRTREGTHLGGMLLAREAPFGEAERALAERLAGTYAHALALLLAEPRLAMRLKTRLRARSWLVLGASIAAMLAMVLPVSMTVLAPFEVAPTDPIIVAAPIEGVIERVLVDPNAEVAAGRTILQLADTQLRNRLEVAEREVLVAEARLKKSTQLAFDDARGRQEVGIALADLALKTAERNFARDLLQRTTLSAPRAGVVLFTDKRSLIGKPVALGERIMQIADPANVEVAIDVPVGDAIVLNPGARVKVFLDSDPIRPRQAIVISADYQARQRPGGTLAYRVVARLSDEADLPRLGVRGIAQVYGETVPLAFYLFRRPLTAARQWIGL